MTSGQAAGESRLGSAPITAAQVPVELSRERLGSKPGPETWMLFVSPRLSLPRHTRACLRAKAVSCWYSDVSLGARISEWSAGSCACAGRMLRRRCGLQAQQMPISHLRNCIH